MMVGKALYDGILLNLAFAPFFLRSLQVRVGETDNRRPVHCTQTAAGGVQQHTVNIQLASTY